MALSKGKSLATRKVRRDYSSKNLSNPFFRHRQTSKRQEKTIVRRPKNKKKAILRKILFFVFPIIILIWFFLVSSVFMAKEIRVDGLTQVSYDEVVAKSWQYIDGNHHNLFLMDTDELSESLSAAFNFRGLKVSRRWPKTILILVTERQPAFILQDSDERRYVLDGEGVVIGGLSADSMPDQLLLKNTSGNSLIKEGRASLSQEFFSFISQLYAIIKGGYVVEDFSISGEFNTVTVKIRDFPPAYFSTKLGADKQLEKLILAKDETEKKDPGSFSGLSYVDLRYGNYVYYK